MINIPALENSLSSSHLFGIVEHEGSFNQCPSTSNYMLWCGGKMLLRKVGPVTVHGESFVAGFCVLAETYCGKRRKNQIASSIGHK